MAQPTRSGPSPILPALAGAFAAAVVVGGAWLALRGGGDDETVTASGTTIAGERAPQATDDQSSEGADDGNGDGDTGDDSAVPTTQRETEDTTNGTTIDDVPLSPLPEGAPDTFVAITSETFELVRVDSQSGSVLERLGSWGLGGDEEAPLQALQFVELAPSGAIYVDDCCEPAYGNTFVVNDSFDPATNLRLQGINPELSLDGTRLARSDLGSAITISDAAGNALGTFGEPDFTGDVLAPLTWIDSSRLVVRSTGDDQTQELQILDVSDPTSLDLLASRFEPDRTYLAADVRADGNILVVTRIDNGTDSGDVIAEVIDSSTGDVLVDFNLADDAYDADYDASGRFVVIARSSGELEWFGGGQRGTLATGYISADW